MRPISFMTESRSEEGVINLPQDIIIFIIDLAMQTVSTHVSTLLLHH